MTDNEIVRDFEIVLNDLKDRVGKNTYNILKQSFDLLNRQKAEIEREHKIVCDYAQAARTIELYLLKFCDKKLPYDEMIADASRKASAEIDRLNLKIRDLNKERVEFSKMHWNDWEIHCNAINEFAERLKKEALIESGFEVLQTGTIDNLVKEMTDNNE